MVNPPKPLEEKLRQGNPGKRALPDRRTLAELAGAAEPPEPPRHLDETGATLWNAIWTSGAVWLAKDVDVHAIVLLCEQMDERKTLREKVLFMGDWHDRAQLRVLEKQIMSGLGAIGFNPTARATLGVAEVKTVTRLEQLRREREREQRAEPIPGEIVDDG